MKKNIILVVLCLIILITKYVVSGTYFDYTLQRNKLDEMQNKLIDDNKRIIAELENYRSANYLFLQKDTLGLSEINPERTIILKSKKPFRENETTETSSN